MNRRAPVSNLFLLELILSITLFALTASICTTFFTKAHILTNDAIQLQQAATRASGIADIARISDTSSDCIRQIQDLFPEAEVSGDQTQLTIYFNQDGICTTSGRASYSVNVAFSVQDNFCITDIVCSAVQGRKEPVTSPILYTLTVKHALDERGDEA
jgi:hypothetical protein